MKTTTLLVNRYELSMMMEGLRKSIDGVEQELKEKTHDPSVVEAVKEVVEMRRKLLTYLRAKHEEVQ